MRSIKHFFEQSWLLIVASFFFGLLIAITNAALSPRIERNKSAKLDELASGLLTTATTFAQVDRDMEVEGLDGRAQDIPVYRAVMGNQIVGWVFQVVGFGFADKIELVVAVDDEFETLAGFDVLASNETPGFGDQIKGDYFRDQFEGAPADELTLVKAGDPAAIDSEIVAISGATVSSTAVVEALDHYLPRIKTQLQQEGLISDDH
jgi:Na+-translocating ferredoxin:NAD+ oxidoreductase subunit G